MTDRKPVGGAASTSEPSAKAESAE